MEKIQCGYRRYLTLAKGKFKISICVHLPRIKTDKTSSAMFFLHSLNGCKLGPNDLFPYIADKLSSRGFYCVRFDYVGNGESTWVKDTDIKSKANDTELVVEYICREFGINCVSLVSISNSASLVFYSEGLAKKINNIFFLSPMFTHIGMSRTPTFGLFSRLVEYARKLFYKETYVKIIQGEIDFRAVFTVIKSNRALSQNMPGESAFYGSPQSKFINTLAAIPMMLIVGSLDPHCGKNMVRYKSYIEKNGFNCTTRILEGAGHNYTSPGDRDKVVSMICQHTNSIE